MNTIQQPDTGPQRTVHLFPFWDVPELVYRSFPFRFEHTLNVWQAQGPPDAQRNDGVHEDFHYMLHQK